MCSYYHIVLDPWLDGGYVVVGRWLIAMNHAIQGHYKTIKQIQDLVLEIERAASTPDPEDKGQLDAVFVSHHLGDHCDRNTLR